MMTAAQRNGELVAHFAGECAALRKAKVVWIGGKPAANDARAGCYEPDVIAIANPPGLRQRQNALIDGFRAIT